MAEQNNTWEQLVEDLTTLYREAERRSLATARFSLAPLGIYFWNSIKFQVFVWLDVFLLIPMSLVIFLRNLFPGEWRYQSFSWPYIKYTLVWFWRGEAPFAPSVHIRWMTTYLLNSHFRRRLLTLRRRIIREDSLPPEKQDSLLSQVDKAVERWKTPGIINMAFTYVLPVGGFVLEIFSDVLPSEMSAWTRSVAMIILAYALSIVGSAAMVKRGLMLEGTGRSSYFPGALSGQGAYAEERRIFEFIGVPKREFPLDIWIPLLAAPITFFWFLGQVDPSFLQAVIKEKSFLIIILIQFAIPVLIGSFVWFRRIKLGRV